MKIRDDFILRPVADMYVVVPIGKGYLDFNGILKLNDSGAFLWNLLQKETDREHLAKALACEYNISKDTALKDVDDYIDMLDKVGCLEV